MEIHKNDIDLIRQLNKGNVAGYRRVFDMFYDSLCHFAYKYLKDKSEAEDVVQETFMALWDNRQDFDTLTSVKSYLYTVTKNKCLNFLSTSSNRLRILEEEYRHSQEFFESQVVEEEVYRLLDQAVRKLPEQSRKIVDLNLQGFKNQEIADQLGISINTVKTLKKNAYKSIRSEMIMTVLLTLLHQTGGKF
ncbi:RNA polymerase sigma-70 factor [Echinicola sediminis]